MNFIDRIYTVFRTRNLKVNNGDLDELARFYLFDIIGVEVRVRRK